ncbi:MAG: hypothetical protein KDK39_00320 [Leptospiraceae bacterium]|nr:hypothetical protein [Leptospiraceae bacterium]
MMRLWVHRLHWYGIPAALIAFLVSLPVHADLLILQDGQELAGHFVREENGGIWFKDIAGQEQFFEQTQVKKLNIGYSGNQVCLTPKDGGPAQCEQKLYKVEKDHLLVTSGKGDTALKKVPLESIRQARIQTGNQKELYVKDALPLNTKISLETDQGTVSGLLIDSDPRQIRIEDQNGQQRTFARDDLAAVIIDPENMHAGALDGLAWRHLYPGIWQYEKGQSIKGLSMGGFFGVASLAALVEYQASSDAASSASSDPSVILFYNTSYRDAWQAHQQKQIQFMAIAAAIYAWYALDIYLHESSGEEPPARESAGAWHFQFGSDTWNGNMVYNPSASTQPGDWQQCSHCAPELTPSASLARAESDGTPVWQSWQTGRLNLVFSITY